MKLYKLNDQNLNSISTKPFDLEKEIQTLIENNVNVIFDLEFVKSELRIHNFRFDTLCFDKETNSFVIIEYKKGTNYSVIDQGYTYLSTLLNNKSDFILEYNETLGKNIKRDQIDWSQSRIIFISPKFSDYQKTSINFKNIPFELWEIMRYKDGIIGLNKINTESDVEINSTLVDTKGTDLVKQVSKEIIRYDEDYHLYKNKNRPDFVVELYRELKERILGIGSEVEIKVGKQTIGFKADKLFTDLIIYNKGIGISINMKKGTLDDPLGITEDLSTTKGHWGIGDYRVWMHSNENIDYVLKLIKQSYNNQL